MANFTITFKIFNESDSRPTPIYKVEVATGLIGVPLVPSIDGDLLLIERKPVPGGFNDVFYGIVKAADFEAFGKGEPFEGQSLYRAHAWNLIFYNLEQMRESIDLMKAQIRGLSEDAVLLSREQRLRSDTYVSPSF